MHNAIAVSPKYLIIVFMFVGFNSWIKYSKRLTPNFEDVMNEPGQVVIPGDDVILSESAVSSLYIQHS